MRALPVGLLLLVAAVAPSAAAVRTVCGVRVGTAGDAALVAGGVEVLELARQGRSQRLLNEADARIGPDRRGERGTQDGSRYCLRVRYRGATPERVLAARRAAP